MKAVHPTTVLLFICLVILDCFLWYQIFFGNPLIPPQVFFLDVGQGDAELVLLPGNVKILTDAGPDRAIVQAIEKALVSSDHYLDVAIITHPEKDHYNGFNELLRRYTVGMFVINGRNAEEGNSSWQSLMQTIREKRIPLVTIGEGDKIKYTNHSFTFLSPQRELLLSAEPNDSGLVALLTFPLLRTLLTADIDSTIEEYLRKRFDLRAHVLKVAHHGSKYSSGEAFLKEVNPLIAVIEVGKENRYGHPAPEALERIASSTNARVFRTDQDGTIRIVEEGNTLKVFTGL